MEAAPSAWICCSHLHVTRVSSVRAVPKLSPRKKKLGHYGAGRFGSLASETCLWDQSVLEGKLFEGREPQRTALCILLSHLLHASFSLFFWLTVKSQEEDRTLIGICFVVASQNWSDVNQENRKTPVQWHKNKDYGAAGPSAVSRAAQVGVRVTAPRLRLCCIRPVLLKSCQIVMTVSPQVMN